LNPERQIREEGFAIIPGVFENKRILDFTEELNACNPPRSRAGVRHAMKLPVVANLAHNSQLMGIAQEILGSEAFPFRATLFDKSPPANWLVVWHQDTAMPLRERREVSGWGPWSVKDGVIYAHAPQSALSQILALRVHLDDSTAENGPLRVLPRTHTLGVLTDDELHELSTQFAAVDCLTPSGGVLAMRPLIVHASSKSQSDSPRRVLHIEYASSEANFDGLELALA
jgi:ectoine hydroxylase-related dioxygenase (phytanoyl-CoA dioxygenase family)